MVDFTLEEMRLLIRNNLRCHIDKLLNKELLDIIMEQVNDSIDYLLDKKDENL